MTKQLSQMSLEELWKLFPVFLTDHQECWHEWYLEEEKNLRELLDKNTLLQISHIGSTAIETIWAKPIVDILIEVSPETDLPQVRDILTGNGYLLMTESTKRLSLNKGYTEHGFSEKVFHIHVRYRGDNDEVYFRDYLNQNPLAAREYEKLKLDLWKKHEHNRDAYTDAKEEIVKKYTEQAKKEL